MPPCESVKRTCATIVAMRTADHPRGVDEHDRRWIKPLFRAALAILGLLVLYGTAVVLIGGAPENVGIFGDMFGGLNALFSGFAFAALIPDNS